MNAKDILPLTKTLNILYVEDDDKLRENTAELFRNLFATVTTASDGQKALECYEKDTFDLIISDILMPNMTGLEMAEVVKEKQSNQAIIFISAYNDAEYFETSISLGIDGYIVKPINHLQLLKALFNVAQKIIDRKENIAYKKHLEEEVQSRTLAFKEALVTDNLTQLPNRLALEHDIDTEHNYCAVLFNIDNFSSVNIGFGYDIGDALLVQVSSKLRESLPENVLLYRIGSDEFLAVSTDLTTLAFKELAVAIQHNFINNQFQLPHEISLRISLTIAIAEASSDKLIRNAQLALYEARKIGKNQLYTFNDSLQIESIQKERIEWINKTRIALENDLLVPYFQPIILNSTKTITKYEALARIVDKDKIITPNYFIEPARMSGQISELTKTMIRKTCEAFSHNNYEFSINIESEDLNAQFLPDYIKHYANKYKIKMDRIVVEVLENIQTYDDKSTLDQLIALKEMGIQIAIDDFGNEQSNFSRLLDIQADYIKIDGQFIKSIDSDQKSYKISSAITSLTKSLDAKIIAEFVHSESVLEKIIDLDIDYSQGYFFGAPSLKIGN
jgi:diguanylate cyclase